MKDKLNKQFGTKKLVLAECYHFYAYKQQDNQSLSEYLAELRRLASTCEWSEEHLADNLRDKFVMGLRNERILQQLLTQDHTKSLDELFQLATTIEAAERETVKRSEVDHTTEESLVSALRNPWPPKGTKINSLHYPGGKSRGHLKSNIQANVLAVVVIMLGKLVDLSVLNATTVERLAISPESVVPRQ